MLVASVVEHDRQTAATKGQRKMTTRSEAWAGALTDSQLSAALNEFRNRKFAAAVYDADTMNESFSEINDLPRAREWFEEKLRSDRRGNVRSRSRAHAQQSCRDGPFGGRAMSFRLRSHASVRSYFFRELVAEATAHRHTRNYQRHMG